MAKIRSAGLLVLAAGSACAGQIAPGPVWVRQLATSQFDSAWAITAHEDRVYVAGPTTGVLGAASAGGWDAFVACLDSGGSTVWVQQFGSPQRDDAAGIAESGGVLFVTGSASGPIKTGPYQGLSDAYVACLELDGGVRWVRQFGSEDRDGGNAAAADGSGGAYIAGSLNGNNGVAYIGFVARYDSEGQQLWVREIAGDANTFVGDAASDGLGGVYVGGRIQVSGDGAWLSRYSGAGERQWFVRFGAGLRASVTGVASDGADGVFVAGWVSPYGTDIPFVARYSRAGERRLYLEIREQIGTYPDIAPDGSGGVYMAWAPMGLGGWEVARISGSGALLGRTSIAMPGVNACGPVAADGSGGAYVAGSTNQGGLLGANAMVARYLAAGPGCYANCDFSTAAPVLTSADFACFLQRYTAKDPYTNCDGSTAEPVLNVTDLTCFLRRFAEGCE